MVKNKGNYRGFMHAKRVKDVERIYDEHRRSGLSNREIWRRYIYPVYPMCERTFYNLVNATADERVIRRMDEMNSQLTLF